MAIIKAVSSHAPIGSAINYITKKEKTELKLISGIGVSPETAKDEMTSTKELYGKTGGRTYKHFIQSFAPGEEITPEQAHKIAKEFAEKSSIFTGFETLFATHKDRDHIHTHFIVNSVSYIDGHKFQMSSKDLQKMKDISDSICRKYGLSITLKGKTLDGTDRIGIVAWAQQKYRFLMKALEDKNAKSYVIETANAVKEVIKTAVSREDFIAKLESKGFNVSWDERHKHITFINADGKKVRDTNLAKTLNLKADKASLEKIFNQNKALSSRELFLREIKDAIISQYNIIEYTSAKEQLASKVASQKAWIEACSNKVAMSNNAIKSIKEDSRNLKQQLGKRSILQSRKKHELIEKIEHNTMLIEAIQSERDAVLSQYGICDAKDLKKSLQDLKIGFETIDIIDQKLTQYKADYSYSITRVINISESFQPENTNPWREQIQQDIKSQLGSDYHNPIYKSAELAVIRALEERQKNYIKKERTYPCYSYQTLG